MHRRQARKIAQRLPQPIGRKGDAFANIHRRGAVIYAKGDQGHDRKGCRNESEILRYTPGEYKPDGRYMDKKCRIFGDMLLEYPILIISKDRPGVYRPAQRHT